MPTVPTQTKCSELGCKNQRSKLNARCLAHGGADTLQPSDQRRKNNAKYNTAQWKERRQIELSKSPLCAGCLSEGKVVGATVVDHIFPWTHIDEGAFTHNSYQPLCTAHHALKSKLELHGIYRHYAETGVKDYSKNDYAYKQAE